MREEETSVEVGHEFLSCIDIVEFDDTIVDHWDICGIFFEYLDDFEEACVSLKPFMRIEVGIVCFDVVLELFYEKVCREG